MSGKAVILAGGSGTRLGPYTTVLPKPLLPIGNRAILDVVVRQLRDSGFDDITIAVDQLARLVRVVFGDGSAHGVRIRYSEARSPMGTAGALKLVDGLDRPFIAMNGDILTTLDHGALYAAHVEAGNVLTLAAHRRVVEVDYGVLVESGNGRGPTRPIANYEEKPEIAYTVSMGVYAVSPEALEFVDRDETLDMPDLIQRLIDAGGRVGSYLYDGLWLDIGRQDDYERALHDYGEVDEAEDLPQAKVGAAPVSLNGA